METKNKSSLMKKIVQSQYINLTGIIVLIITFGTIVTIVNPLFLSKANILNVGRQMVVFGIIACALSFPQIAGNTDMGIESVGALCGAITCELVSNSNPGIIQAKTHPVLAILIGVVIGALCGLLNGVLIAYTTIPAFIVTLGTQTALRGMTYIITNNMPIAQLDERFLWLSEAKLFGINIQIYFLACFFLVTAFILNKTTFGRKVFAVGGNAQAAYQSGINVKRITLYCYIICGIIASLAGILLSARTNSAQPTAMNGYSTVAISACAMGGVPLEGGEGSVIGMVFGSLMMAMLTNGMNMMKLSTNYQYIFRGVMLILSVFYAQWINKKTASLARE